MEKNGQSYYNEGYFQIQRLNNLWLEANMAAKAGSFERWRWVLDTVWRELSPDVILNGAQKNFKGFNWREKNRYYNIYVAINNSINENKENPKKLYEAIQEYEFFLRWLANEFGKGGKYTDPDEDGID